MSTLALKVLLERLSTKSERPGGKFDNKELKKAVAYKQTHSLILDMDSLVEEFTDAFTKAYKLDEDEQDEITGIVIEEWPGIVASARKELKNTKDIEVVIEANRIVIIYYGNKSNYYRIDDQFFKNDAKYSHWFKPMMERIRFFLVGQGNRVIQKRTDKAGKIVKDENGKPVEALGIADLFNQGHYQGSSIHYTMASQFMPTQDDPTNYLQNPDILNVIKTSKIEMAPYNSEVSMLLEAASKITGGAKPLNNDFKKTITVKLESKVSNQLRGATDEAGIRTEFVNHIKRVLARTDAMDWVDQESSDSFSAIIEKGLVNIAVDLGAKGKKKSVDVKSGRANITDTVKIKNRQTKVKVSGTGRTVANRTGRPQAVPSYLALMELINAKLPPKVRSNMGHPRLENQSGRLSESARVTQITPTPMGFPSIEYTYQRSPYDVFDKTLGKAPWNTPGRDPSELIGMSVRQLATELGMRRFYIRRAP